MKFSLFSSVSSAALGAGLLAVMPGAAHAALTCTTLVPGVSGDCSETDYTNGGVGVALTSSFSDLGNPSVTIDTFVAGTNQHLKSVVITEAGVVTPTGSFTAGGSGVFKVGLTTGFELGATGSTPGNFPVSLALAPLVKKSYTLTNGQFQSIAFSQSIGTTSATLHSGLSAYESSSPSFFTVDFLGEGSQFESGPTITGYTIAGTAIGTLTITYNYTTSISTPEPASLALLGIGLGGIGVIRRRRKA